MPMRVLRLCLVLGGLSLVLAAAVWVEARAFGLESTAWRPCACAVLERQSGCVLGWGAGAAPGGAGRGSGTRRAAMSERLWD